jgi:MFS family permease
LELFLFIEATLIARQFPALSSRNFRLFWYGQFVSLIGTWMQNTTLPFLAYRLTDQPILLGAIGFVGSLPALILMLPSGVIIERLDKRKAVIILQAVMMLQALSLAFLALTKLINIYQILALALVLGIANSLEITARQSMIVSLVDKEDLPNAIALNSTIFNAARVLGPSLTAPFLILIQGNGEGWAFLANGISYIFVIIGLLMVRLPPHQKSEHTTIHKNIEDFVEGQHYVRKNALIAFLIGMVAIPSFFGFPFTQQIPVFARDVLKIAGDTEAAIATRNSLLVIAQGVGALIAAITLAVFSNMRHQAFLLTIGQFAFAIGLIGIGLFSSIHAVLFLMALTGWGMVTHLALTNTLIQLEVPDHLRGRVISTYFWAQSAAAPFGSLFIGWLAQNWGAPIAVMFGGTVCLIGYLLMHLIRPSMHKIIK